MATTDGFSTAEILREDRDSIAASLELTDAIQIDISQTPSIFADIDAAEQRNILLNLAQGGAAEGMVAGIATTNGNTAYNTQQRKEKEKQIKDATNSIVAASQASSSALTIDPITLENFRKAIQDGMTARAEELQNEFDLLLASAEAEPPGIIRDSIQARIEENFSELQAEFHSILLEQDPIGENGVHYSEMSPEEQQRYLRETFLVTYAERHELTIDEAQERLRELWEDAANNPDAIAALKAIANSTILSESAKQTSDSISRAVELTDEMNDKEIVTFQYDYGGTTTYTPVYVGTAISDDEMDLINDGTSPVKYYSANSDGSFYEIPLQYAIISSPEKGTEFAQQIRDSGLDFADLSEETRDSLFQEFGVTDLDSLCQQAESMTSISFLVGSLMFDENFVQTVGTYALHSGIEAEIADGQVFANDPRISELTEQAAVIAEQEENIQRMEEQLESMRENLSNPYMRGYLLPEIDILEADLAAARSQLDTYTELTATIQSLKDLQQEVEDAAARNEPHHLSPEVMERLVAEQEAEIEALQREILGEETELPEPAPSPDSLQSTLDQNLDAITELVTSGYGISEDELRTRLQEMGISESEMDQAIEMISEQIPNANITPRSNTMLLSQDTTLMPAERDGSTGLNSQFAAAAAPQSEPAPSPQPQAPEVDPPKETVELAAAANSGGSMNMTG